MTFWALSGLINGITSSVLGSIIYVKNRRHIINITYSLFCLSIAIWSYAYFLWQISTDKISALFWCRALMAGAIFIPICYLHHIITLIDLSREKKKIITFGYIFGFISLGINFTPWFVKSVSPKMWFKFWPDAGIAYYPFLAIWFWIVLYGVYTIIKSLHSSTGIMRNQLKYILAATLVGWSGGATNYPLWFDIRFPPIGNILVSGYIIIAAYAIAKYNLMGFDVAAKELLAKILSFSMLTGVAYLSVTLIINLLNITQLPMIIISSLTSMAIFYSLHRKFSSIISQKIRPRPDFQAILKEYTEIDMMAARTSTGLAELVVKRISDNLKPTVCSLMLLDKETGLYNVIASSGKDEEIKTINFKPTNHLIAALKNSHHLRLIVKDELNKLEFPQEDARLIKRDLEILKAQISIPLILHGELTGLLNLGTKTSGELYTPEEIGFIFIFISQSAFMMSFLDKIHKLHELEIKAEKLAGLINLLDGLSHEFGNQMGTVKFYIENVDNPDYQEAMENYLQHARESSANIMLILSSIKDYRLVSDMKELSCTRIKQSIDSALIEWKDKFASIAAKITTNIPKDLLTIETYPSFQYLFSNLFINCYFALAQRKPRLLNIKACQTQDPQRPIEVVITDTGGDLLEMMQKQALSSGGEYFPERGRIGGFHFFLAKQIVDDHRGELIIERNPPVQGQVGTIFIIRLPLTQPKE